MLSQLFSAIYSETFTPEIYFICTAVSLVLGAVIAFTAGFRAKQSKSFLLALFLIPAIVQTVIMLVNGSVGTGVAVMGAFSLVRFRSVAGSARRSSASSSRWRQDLPPRWATSDWQRSLWSSSAS